MQHLCHSNKQSQALTALPASYVTLSPPCSTMPLSEDSPEVHANTAETLCAITRFAPPGLSAKICSPSFIGRLFRHALEDSRPKSVLVNSLSICISLLDPKRHSFGGYHSYNRQMNNGSTVTANPEAVEGMLESLEPALIKIAIQPVPNQPSHLKLTNMNLSSSLEMWNMFLHVISDTAEFFNLFACLG
ncbi:serine/threonine-protein phosphatase 6 regulatory subunit 3 isoform X2 [Senna tora]|uniref:Serine/threonine-protein phosphatase 6 regulatory subunit 3 isoform X2 n=1 Tax=Senna tora TaxID=362788 RepID=A0A835CHI3_9FABA|nr:serine/threonine-protein phosphatase 6 regulatory subunit 3 isoform X2 [Senna tora]